MRKQLRSKFIKNLKTLKFVYVFKWFLDKYDWNLQWEEMVFEFLDYRSEFYLLSYLYSMNWLLLCLICMIAEFLNYDTPTSTRLYLVILIYHISSEHERVTNIFIEILYLNHVYWWFAQMINWIQHIQNNEFLNDRLFNLWILRYKR